MDAKMILSWTNSALFPRWLATVCCIVAIAVALPVAAFGKEKKVIYYGWGLPDTQYARDHWREMENMPFDGVGIRIAIDRALWQRNSRGDMNTLGWQLMGTRLFRIEDFSETIKDLKSLRGRRLTDNFLPVALSVFSSAKGVNWFDDRRWRIIENNFKVIAGIARQGRVRGLIIDPEHYGYLLFNYPAQRKQINRTFADYQQMARERGRQLMRAIAAELSPVTILTFVGHSYLFSEWKSRQRIDESLYGLLPAFFDGMIEAMPEGATFVDGFEASYGYKLREQFQSGYQKILEAGSALSFAPEAYSKRVQVGFGLWIDYGKKFNHFKPESFQEALTAALEVSDRYVWIYGQTPSFFPPSNIPDAYIEAVKQARLQVKTSAKPSRRNR